MFQYLTRLRATTLDDLLLVDVFDSSGVVLLVSECTDVLSASALELEQEVVDLLLQFGGCVVIQHVGLAQGVENLRVATQVVKQFTLELEHVRDLERIELALRAR